MTAADRLVLTPFYRLRFIATGMSMLSAVLLPWLGYTATQRIAAAGLVMLIEASVRLLMDYLTTDAPLWKKQTGGDGTRWIEPMERDLVARAEAEIL